MKLRSRLWKKIKRWDKTKSPAIDSLFVVLIVLACFAGLLAMEKNVRLSYLTFENGTAYQNFVHGRCLYRHEFAPTEYEDEKIWYKRVISPKQ